MEDLAIGPLNIFDLLARMVPGMLVLAWSGAILKVAPPAGWPESVVLLTFVACSYAVGLALRPFAPAARRLGSLLLHGGTGRRTYLEGEGRRLPVIGNEATRELAKRCVAQVCRDRLGIEDDSELAFGFMVNALEVLGKAEKSNRIQGLADCSLSCALATLANLLVFVYALGGPGIPEGFPDARVVLSGMAACIFAFGFVASRYGRMRFTIVIRTYASLVDVVAPPGAEPTRPVVMTGPKALSLPNWISAVFMRGRALTPRVARRERGERPPRCRKAAAPQRCNKVSDDRHR